MTQTLRDVLQDEAASAQVPPTDLGPVLAAGGRAVRRRRRVGATTIAAAALAAVVAVASIVVRQGPDDDVIDPPPPGPWSGAWADAESIHFGDVRAPRPEHLYEMAAGRNGLLYIDWDELGTSGWAPESKVFWLSSDGEVRQIGDAAFARPDVAGKTAAWFEDPDGENVITGRVRDPYTLVVYDTARMKEITRLPGVTAEDGWPPSIVGISGSRIYYERQNAGSLGTTYWSWDYNERGEPPTRVDVPLLMDVSAGVRAEGSGPDRNEGDRFTDEDGNLIATADGLSAAGRLSFDGNYFLSRDGDGWVVARTDGSERASLELDGWYLSWVAGWDASGHVTVLAARSGDPGLETDRDGFTSMGAADASVVSCSPVDGSCEVVAESVGQGDELVLADTVEENNDRGLK